MIFEYSTVKNKNVHLKTIMEFSFEEGFRLIDKEKLLVTQE